MAWKNEMKVAQSCLTVCDPMDSTVRGILQARILEWVAFPFSRGSSQPRDWTQVSCIGGGFFTSWATREAHFMAYRWGNSKRLYFLGLQITADGDCIYEIIRCLFLGRKAMTNLDRVLKNRDITLLTKVHIKLWFFQHVKVTQSCLTLCDPMDCSPWNFPGQNTEVGSLSLL